jgi:hypothetical protein
MNGIDATFKLHTNWSFTAEIVFITEIIPRLSIAVLFGVRNLV